MKSNKFFSMASLFGCAMALMSSCSSDEEFVTGNDEGMQQMHTVKMLLSGSLQSYDNKDASHGATRATGDLEWEDGARIYLLFSTDKGEVSGKAVYSETDNQWEVSYYGTITKGTTGSTCKAFYFEDAVSENSSVVQLSDRSAIYEETNGSYTFDNDILQVVVNLKPKTGRMRFSGENGTTMKIIGITHYSLFDAETGKLHVSSAAVCDTVAKSSDYTPYIYGYFSDADAPMLGVVVDNSKAYTMQCSTDIYNAGESGWLDIPTDESHNGWTNGLNFTVGDVNFKMMPVEWGTKSFLIGETEVTEELYNAVTDGTTKTPNFPARNISYSAFSSFVQKLNALTSLNFRFPTTSEWQYAAKGGSESLGFTYSGSNTPDDVAWYSGNCSTAQPVKQKQPNELGIYDMSGNVAEFCDGSNYYYGGSYNSTTSNIKPTSYEYGYSAYDYVGLRLAFTLK